MDSKLIVFQGKNIRRVWHKDEWYFSVVDIVSILTEQPEYQKARKYWNKLNQRLKEEGGEMVTICHQLKLISPDGKYYATDCANTKSLFRIIQSIPSRKAEPFKQWLAKVGYERIQEIENPELAQDRAKEYYEIKGYPKSWIDKRLRGIAVRQELTEEWKNRGIKEKTDTRPSDGAPFLQSKKEGFAILTNEISKATFGLTINQHKTFKGLDSKFKNQNLRDNTLKNQRFLVSQKPIRVF